MTTVANVHVGDVGTRYKGKIQDNGVAFDPTLATVKKILFKGPGGTVERAATITTEGADAAQEWFLNYTVVTADTDFHLKGNYAWQGYVEFAGGERYHTNIETYTVDKNLEVTA